MPKPIEPRPTSAASKALPALPPKRARRRSTRASYSWRFRTPPSRKRVDVAKGRFQPELILAPQLAPLNSFVLPGGSPLAAALHVSRTIVRRAERDVVQLVHNEPETSGQTVIYLNRLSDLLFVIARVANQQGKNDVLWMPGRYRARSEQSDE